MKAGIYTKKGDWGETGLFSGQRVGKDDKIIEAIGAVDELNAQIGIVTPKMKFLRAIQNDLFAIGSILAGSEIKIDLEQRVADMEQEIDLMWEKMPPLKNFILPRGQIHLARTVCRRAERRICAVPIIHNTYPMILVYLNRLSDCLFCLARWVNYREGREEIIWGNTP